MKPSDWVLLIGGALLLAFLSLITPVYAEDKEPMPYVDEACARSFACQDRIIYELVYQDRYVVSIGDLSQDECEEMKAEVEAQTPPFTKLECRARLVERTEL